MNRQDVVQKFIWGMASLSSYVHFNNLLNLHDINIFSENFIRDLLNIIDGRKLNNANCNNPNNPGFDLIDEDNKILIQVTSTDDPKKIKMTWDSMKRNYDRSFIKRVSAEDNINVSGYSFLFFILRNHAANIKKYCKKHVSDIDCPSFLSFDPKKNVFDLGDLVIAVNDLASQPLYELERLMLHNSRLFSRIEYRESNDKVHEIIKEYADNFTARMFLHTYRPDSRVSLQNVYIQPKYRFVGSDDDSRDMLSLVSRFICENPAEHLLYIDGDAAVGKTSLVSWLCYYYSFKDETDNYYSLRKSLFLDKQLVCVRLRELDFKLSRRSPIETVLSYLQIADLREFHRIYSDALIVLDGVDEISMVDDLNVYSVNAFINDIRKAFSNNKMIITGRPHFFDVEEIRSNQFHIRHIELLHYDGDMRKEWMEKYEKCGEAIPVSTKNYILDLAGETAVGVADTPLALYMLVSCEIKDELCGNRWALFHEIFRNAIIKTEYNENFSGSSPHPISWNADEIYRTVCNISFKMFMNSSQERYFITSKELDDIIKKTEGVSIPRKQFRKSCVLCAYWKSNLKNGALEFYHNDIRDFFFSEYIYDVLNARIAEYDQSSFVSDFFEDMCMIFRYGSVPGSTWEQTFEFLYLRLSKEAKDAQPEAIAIIEVVLSRYPELVGKLLDGSEILRKQLVDINYSLVKQITINTLLLLNVVVEAGFRLNEIHRVLPFGSDERQKNHIVASGILNNWCEIFTNGIHISENEYIQFGKYLDLSSIEFQYIDLSVSDFTCADLSSARFVHVNLKDVSFSHAALNGTIFSDCDLTGTDFSSAKIENAVFKDCIFKNTKFNSAVIYNCEFSTKQRFSASFKKAELKACQMDRIIFENSFFCNAEFHRVSLNGADFTGIKTMENVTFMNCNMEKTVFDKIVLTGVDFSNTTLYGTHFIAAKFQNCFLNKSKLSETDFRGAEFRHTAVSKASMSLCNTDQATFDGMSFYNLSF